MESTQIHALYEPPLAAMPQLSEKPRQGFETKKTAWNPGPSVYNSTAAIGLRAGLALECVRETRQTGLYYVQARYYNPNLGRFLQTDPSGVQGGLNLYAYAGNDPVNSEDHSGQSPDGGGYTVTLTESVPTTFMRLFGISSLTVSVSVKIPDIVVKCRGIETYNLGALGFHHCDAEVVDGSGVVYSLSAGPMGSSGNQVLQAWATPNPTTPFTGTTIYSEYANQSVVQGLINSTDAWHFCPVHPRYNLYAGPNSNTWLTEPRII
jgi:RHS repeat-associated protein